MTAGGWRKAAASSGNGQCVEVGWRKSSASIGNGQCAEVGGGPAVFVRDSANRGGPVLEFTPAGWRAFTVAVRGGRDGRGDSL